MLRLPFVILKSSFVIALQLSPRPLMIIGPSGVGQSKPERIRQVHAGETRHDRIKHGCDVNRAEIQIVIVNFSDCPSTMRARSSSSCRMSLGCRCSPSFPRIQRLHSAGEKDLNARSRHFRLCVHAVTSRASWRSKLSGKRCGSLITSCMLASTGYFAWVTS